MEWTGLPGDVLLDMGTSREFDTWKVQNEKLEIFSKENGAHAAYALVVI